MKVVYDLYMTRVAHATKVACDKIVLSKLAFKVALYNMDTSLILDTLLHPFSVRIREVQLTYIIINLMP